MGSKCTDEDELIFSLLQLPPGEQLGHHGWGVAGVADCQREMQGPENLAGHAHGPGKIT